MASYEGYVTQIAGIAQGAQDEHVRAAAFRTAGYLAGTCYWLDYSSNQIEGIEAGAAQLGSAQPGQPVLLVGQDDDGTRSFSAGTLDGRLELAFDGNSPLELRPQHHSGIVVSGRLIEHQTYRPIGETRELQAAAHAAVRALGMEPHIAPPTQRAVGIRDIDILQSDPHDRRLITGADAISVMVGVLLDDSELDVDGTAELVRGLDHIGMPLTQLGFTQDSLTSTAASFRAELERLGDPDRPGAPAGIFTRVEDIQTALQTVLDHSEQV